MRRFDMSCSPRKSQPAYSHIRRASLLRWSGSNMNRVQRGSSSKMLETMHASNRWPNPTVDESQIRDRAVQSDVVGVGGVACAQWNPLPPGTTRYSRSRRRGSYR